MKKLLLLLFLLPASIIAQEEIITIPNIVQNINQSFYVKDSKTGNLAIFLEDADQVHGILYDSSFNKIGQLSAPDLASKFQSFVGYQIMDEKIILFMNTENDRSYGKLIYDFKNNTTESDEIEFKLKGEKLIKTASVRNSFFVFSIVKNSSTLNLYEFKGDNPPERYELSFEDTAFKEYGNKPSNLYGLITKSENFNVSVDAAEIEKNVPQSIDNTSKKVKFYNDENNVDITIDANHENTYLININLITKEKSIKTIPQPELAKSYVIPKSNSFLSEDKLYQLIANSDELKFKITDINTQSVLKAIDLEKNEDIYFKNTPIIQEGGAYDNYRELEKTSKFLRKLKNADIGLSVYNQNGNYEITFGSHTEIQQGGFMFYGNIGIAGAVFVGAMNGIWAAYYGYTRSKSVRITGLFDKQYTHLDGEVPANAFDNIRTFSEEQKRINAETIFKIDNDFYWGAYFKGEDTFKIFKF